MEETNVSRVRMNISLTAKGLAQFDITAEFENADKSAEELDKAIKKVREVLKANNIKEVGSASKLEG